MAEFLCLFGPGILTWLLSVKLSKKRGQNIPEDFMEVIAFSAFDLVIFWTVLHFGLGFDILSIDEVLEKLSGNIAYFAAAFLGAVVIGFFAAMLRTVDLKIVIENNPDGFWNRLSMKKRRILKRVLAAAAIVTIAAVILTPKVNAYLMEKSRTDCRQTASTMLAELKDLVKETELENLGDLTVNQMTVKRVEKDQHWTTGCSEGTAEAVYMVDGDGTVVYFSYRNRNYTATWSGPSSDEEFLEEQGGWNGGNGSGWTGTSIG